MTGKRSNPVRTVLVITVGLIIIFLATKKPWTIKAAVVIGLAGFFSDYLAIKIDWLWMKLSWLLSKIVPNLILSAVFFLLLTPVAFLAKIFSDKNPLHLKNTAGSLFTDSNKTFSKESFEKPW